MLMLERIVAYWENRPMLAWALIYIMHLVYKAKVTHNDLTENNILLHFAPDEMKSVYIGVCDWGIASRVVEMNSSNYHNKSEADCEV